MPLPKSRKRFRFVLKVADIPVVFTSNVKIGITPGYKTLLKDFIVNGIPEKKAASAIRVAVELVRFLPDHVAGKEITRVSSAGVIDKTCAGILAKPKRVKRSLFWKLLRLDDERYVFQGYESEKLIQVGMINEKFNRVRLMLPDRVMAGENKALHGPHASPNKQWLIDEVVIPFLYVMIENYLVLNRGCIVHAAGLVLGKGGALLCVGNSGAGKSTISRLWSAKYDKKKVFNDDRVIVRMRKNRCYLYGTPWLGDIGIEGYRPVNEGKGLSGVFLLRHSLRNHATKISVNDALPVVLSNSMVPYSDERQVLRCLMFWEDLFRKIPSYRFGFTKSKRSVDYLSAFAESL